MPEEYFLTLVGPRVAPATRPAASGLPLEDGHTLPFVVDRGWVGPAGTYIEQWSIRDGERILYRHPAKYIEVRGFQSVRRFSDTVRVPLRLEPGIYDITFVVEDYRMGSFAVEAGPLSEHPEAPPPAEPAAAPPAAAVVPEPAPAPTPKPAAAAPPAPKPAAAAVAAPATPAAYTGEDPAAVRKRVYEEELAKGSDPRVAEARSKSAEIKAKKAMAAAATQAPAAAPAAEPAAAPPASAGPAPAPAAEPAPAPPAAPPPEAGRAARPAAVGLRPGEPIAPPPAAPEPDPSTPAAATPAVPASSGEDPAAVRKRVYEEELAKGSDPRVAEARAKSAEIRAKRAASAPAAPAAPTAPRAAAPPPASPAPPAPAGPLLPDAPPDGGGMTAADAASVRAMVFQQEVDQGTATPVAEALAKAAEIRVQRGVWWRPDW
jgi:hypothetical protein